LGYQHKKSQELGKEKECPTREGLKGPIPPPNCKSCGHHVGKYEGFQKTGERTSQIVVKIWVGKLIGALIRKSQ